MEEFELEGNVYRIKKMNAIEVLAMQSQYDLTSYKTSLTTFETALEKVEVKCNDQWLPVKTPGKNIYYPNGVEDNYNVIKKLVSNVVKYINSVFPKSNG